MNDGAETLFYLLYCWVEGFSVMEVLLSVIIKPQLFQSFWVIIGVNETDVFDCMKC